MKTDRLPRHARDKYTHAKVAPKERTFLSLLQAVRIPAGRQLLSEIGLSQPADWLDLVEYVQAGTDFYSRLASDTDFGWLRAQIPLAKAPLLWEVTSMSLPMQPHGLCRSGQDKMTAEQLRTYALDAYSLGADGVSAFNFQYYRPTGSRAEDVCEGTPLGSGRGAPLFSVLSGLRCENVSFSQFCIKRLFCQARPGTHIGKLNKRDALFAGTQPGCASKTSTTRGRQTGARIHPVRAERSRPILLSVATCLVCSSSRKYAACMCMPATSNCDCGGGATVCLARETID